VFKQFIERIQQLGAEHVILSTDLGQPGNPSHTEGLREFVARALAAGITQADLDMMLKTNPAMLLGLQ
jgi:predicted TIM-barrel fold metal-dependent hydrolase